MTRAVISTIGRDRPGIVNELSEIVASLGLNIEDSRMTVLGGEFAVLMSVAGDEPALAALQRRLKMLATASDFAWLYRPTTARDPRDTRPLRIRVRAMDHPGIVHGVASFFTTRHINIRELETQTEPAAHTGTPIFNLEMTLEIPSGDDPRELTGAFAAFCEQEGLDAEMTSGKDVFL